MGNLVFLPWAENDKPIDIGEFILTPMKEVTNLSESNLSFKESDLLKELNEDDFTKI